MDTINLVVNIEDKGGINISPIIQTAKLEVTIGTTSAGGIELATASEYNTFKAYMNDKINQLLEE